MNLGEWDLKFEGYNNLAIHKNELVLTWHIFFNVFRKCTLKMCIVLIIIVKNRTKYYFNAVCITDINNNIALFLFLIKYYSCEFRISPNFTKLRRKEEDKDEVYERILPHQTLPH